MKNLDLLRKCRLYNKFLKMIKSGSPLKNTSSIINGQTELFTMCWMQNDYFSQLFERKHQSAMAIVEDYTGHTIPLLEHNWL